jgi:hypothetical protein
MRRLEDLALAGQTGVVFALGLLTSLIIAFGEGCVSQAERQVIKANCGFDYDESLGWSLFHLVLHCSLVACAY